MILLVGPLPPPVGGVSIHCQRLLLSLGDLGFELQLINSRKLFDNLLTFFRLRSKISVVHIHVSSSLGMSLYALAALLLTRAQVMITVHSNYKRHRSIIDQLLLNLAIAIANKVFVLNKSSYNAILKLNKSSILSSSFIPFRIPERGSKQYMCLSCFCLDKNEKYSTSLDEHLIRRYTKVVSTTAWRLVRENGLEVYGISEIICLCKYLPSVLFVISDPSGEYLNFAEHANLWYSNVIYITEPHRFVDVLSFSDLFIRNTTTDGDSISIRESLYMGVPVAASSSVERPIGCITYERLSPTLISKILFADDSLLRSSLVPLCGNGCSNETVLPSETSIIDFYQFNFKHELRNCR
jgi:hypothetical protein